MVLTRVLSVTSNNDDLIIHWLGASYPGVAKRIKLPLECYLPLKEALEKIVSLHESAYKTFPDTRVGDFFRGVRITFHDKSGYSFAIKPQRGGKGIYLLPEDAKDLLKEMEGALK